MRTIRVEAPDAARLAQLGVERWPEWQKGVSEFPWEYAATETRYILAGHVIVTPAGGTPEAIAQRDRVAFPPAMTCTWKAV